MNRVLRVLCVAPASDAYLWEMEILIHSLCRVGFPADQIVWVSYPSGDGGVEAAEALAVKYGVDLHMYDDEIPEGKYPTRVRPYLLYRYFLDNPDRLGDECPHMYVDSDVCFSTCPSVDDVDVSCRRWVGSDVSWYVALGEGERVFPGIAAAVGDACGVSGGVVDRFWDSIPGAQWLMCVEDPELWLDVFHACESTYQAVLDVSGERRLAWIADMWATPLVATNYGVESVCDERMDFTLSCDDSRMFSRNMFFHNSGYSEAEVARLGGMHKGDFRKCSFGDSVFVVNGRAAVSEYLMMATEVFPELRVFTYSGPECAMRHEMQPDLYGEDGLKRV